MMPLCSSCDKRSLCNSLCPEAELYAKQDEVSQHEKTIGLINYGKWPERISSAYLTPREKSILTLLGQGLTRKQVSIALNITMGSVRWHLLNIRNKS